LTKARHAMSALAQEAFSARDKELALVASEGDWNKAAFGLLVAAARAMRNEISRSIRDNCAGAVLQIAWTLFDAHLDLLGIPLENRRDVKSGHLFSGAERFSRVLWASRNAFAHGPEWRAGGPKTPAGRLSAEILRAVGVNDPLKEDIFNLFILLGDGDIEVFIGRLQEAAKEVATATPVTAIAPAQADAAATAAVGLLVIGVGLLAYHVIKTVTSDTEGIVAFQFTDDDHTVSVPIAKGKLGSPMQFRTIIEEEAVLALSLERAAPFKEADARLKAWNSQLEALSAIDVGSARFYRDLLDLSDRIEEIYALVLRLPEPFQLLVDERGCRSLEECHALMASLLEAHGFRKIPYREVQTSALSLNDSAKAGTRRRAEVTVRSVPLEP
jgi:hypothetical protein